tara:strand:+ start:7187 stop:8080 length:894 start_codon:yes stop_codon:yes gene_type:complete
MPIPPNNPLVTLPMVSPFDTDGKLDLDAAQRNVQRWLKTPISGYLIGSQSGEEFLMNEQERNSLLRTVTDSLAGETFSIGGIDSPSAIETLRQAENYVEAGAEMLRIRFPREESLVPDYFHEILPRCPVPVLLMHQTSPSSFGIAARPAATPEVIGEIAGLENVFGYVTDHDMRFEAQVRRHVPADKRFWICNGSMILSGTLIGCNGTTTAFANIWPAALKELLDLGMAGNYDQGQSLQEQIRLIDEIMLPYLAGGIKTCLRLMGFEGMNPRNPTRVMSPEKISRLETVLREAELMQ